MKSACRRLSSGRGACFFFGALAIAASAPEDAISVARMRADLDVLCSPKLAGRLSLSSGAAEAARYLAEQFRKAGLKPAMQEFPLIAFDPDRERTHLTLTRDGKITTFPEGMHAAYWREASIDAPLVFAGYGITAPEYGYDEYESIDVRGKAVVILDREPQENDPRSAFNGTGHTRHANVRSKIENAMRHGAVAVLMVTTVAPARTVAPGEQSLRINAPRQSIEEPSIPLAQIGLETARSFLGGRSALDLKAAIDSDLKPRSTTLDGRINLATAPAHVRRGKSANVVALIEGSDPALRGETILITAHYDHLGTRDGHLYGGANDNASGSVGVLELARLFAAAPVKPKRSMLFVIFGSEEEGLLGSYYYVEHPLRPLATTRAVINLDMIARDEAHITQSRGVLEIPGDTHNEINLVGTFYSPELRDIIVDANAKSGLDISTKFDGDHSLNVLFRCDHFPFLMHNVPAVWLFGGFHPGYHEPSDTIDLLNFPKLEKVVRLAYWTAVSIGNTIQPPRFE